MAASTRSNGTRSRNAILDRGLELAASAGRHSATIGALAGALGMSKSGVFSHFGSKEGLDLALIDAAAERFAHAVAGPAHLAPSGVARLSALAEGWLAESEGAPGALAVLLDRTPASEPAVRARTTAWRAAWRSTLAEQVAEAAHRGELAPGSDPGQAAFEIEALLMAAFRGAEAGDAAAPGRARLAIEQVLTRLSTEHGVRWNGRIPP